jgi:hypothetical protein
MTLAADGIVFNTTDEHGVVNEKRVATTKTELWLNRQLLVSVGDDLARATRLEKLFVRDHALSFLCFVI